jgi:orotidine-5'-phosphate decarboxylase
MARVAQDAGLDGVVCSGKEVRRVKETLGSSFITVVPGIRPAGASRDDQRRVLTPAGALQEGADYLVIGRPITAAPNPADALEKVLEEMDGALAAS